MHKHERREVIDHGDALVSQLRYRKKYQVRVYWDDTPPNPRRDWDNVGIVVIWDRHGPNHIISDESPSWGVEDHPKLVALGYNAAAFGDTDFDEVPESCVDTYYDYGDIIMLPIFGRDPYQVFEPLPEYYWDRDMVSGYIHMTWETASTEYKWACDPQLAFPFMGGQKILLDKDAIRKQAVDCMRREIGQLNDFCEGKCMGYDVIDVHGQELISQSWGYLGYDEDEMMALACAEVDTWFPKSVLGNKTIARHPKRGNQLLKTLTKLSL